LKAKAERSGSEDSQRIIRGESQTLDPKAAGRLIESASWRSTGRFSRRVGSQRKLEIGPKVAQG